MAGQGVLDTHVSCHLQAFTFRHRAWHDTLSPYLVPIILNAIILSRQSITCMTPMIPDSKKQHHRVSSIQPRQRQPGAHEIFAVCAVCFSLVRSAAYPDHKAGEAGRSEASLCTIITLAAHLNMLPCGENMNFKASRACPSPADNPLAAGCCCDAKGLNGASTGSPPSKRACGTKHISLCGVAQGKGLCTGEIEFGVHYTVLTPPESSA